MTARVHRATQHRSGIPGVEAMTLFSNHAFPRHSHDHFGIGIMTEGAQRSWSVVGQVEAAAGDVIMCNPGEMHDGLPADTTARAWRILYFAPALIAGEITQDMRGEPIVPPVVRDRQLAALVTQLFAHVEREQPDALAIEEVLMRCLMIVSRKHRLDGAVAAGGSPPVRTAIRRLDEAPEDPVSLADLARLTGVSRFQLLRGFAREVGTTPHAYVMQRRARFARQHLAAGRSPSEAALLAGFADQSHMTRAFVRYFGITPARYRAALA